MNLIEPHTHDGINSPPIDPKDLLGFPIAVTAPTDAAQNGTIRLALISGTYYLYARINSVWKKVSLS